MIQIVLLRKNEKGETYHCHPVGFPTGYVASNIHALFSNLGAITEKLRQATPTNLENVYYTVAHHGGLGQGRPSRDKNSFLEQDVLAFDIDYIDQLRVWEYLPIVAKVLNVAPQSLIFVGTGNGVHIIAHLKTPIRSTKYMQETKRAYNELVSRINDDLKAAGLVGSCDPVVYEPGRILRMPNSVNSKIDKKTGLAIIKECKLLQYPGLIQFDLDLMKISGLDRIDLENISLEQVRKNYPKPDFQEVMKECEFMKWLVAKPEEIHEPQFQIAAGIMSAMDPSDKALYDGEDTTPREVLRGIFDKACNSNSLAGVDFDKKTDHAAKYGVAKCSTVSANWLGGCERCPHQHKIATPLALKSQAHISSELNGYWVMGKNGPLHPHYSDLSKVYKREHSYVSCTPDRIYTFEQTHYNLTDQLMVKNWLERKSGYEEHLRELHCNEFVKKVLRTGAISSEQEKNLFEASHRGKLNCRNGIVDIKTGELSPHNPRLGFKYVLPYDFVPGETSEFFINWLMEVMQDNTELADAVLDMMAYCLWPAYDDHVFMYLIGEGRNGKSTLLHLLSALVGPMNSSEISIFQLASNRFAPAGLEGKLVNLSEESSGNSLSTEELNIIKTLSAGGTATVENKNEKGFKLVNTTKLIFSANKPPKFHESGHALRERLIVIPFNLTFKPDKRVEDRLLEEIPKICSMLVRRTQEILAANNGVFKIRKGGQTANVAQEKLLLAGNSVVEWGKECIESNADLPEDRYISSKEAYDRYKVWCQDNSYKPVTSTVFGYTMTHGVLSKIVENSKVIRVGGKHCRIFPHTQWKEEIL